MNDPRRALAGSLASAIRRQQELGLRESRLSAPGVLNRIAQLEGSDESEGSPAPDSAASTRSRMQAAVTATGDGARRDAECAERQPLSRETPARALSGGGAEVAAVPAHETLERELGPAPWTSRAARPPRTGEHVAVGGGLASISELATGELAEHVATAERDALRSASSLEALRTLLGECTRCGLCSERTQIVFGCGASRAELMFVGEGPGAEEDASGVPFVGRAGQLLDRMIAAMGLEREAVHIANVVKCRPPGNRTPAPAEIGTCLPFLREQIRLVEPRVVVTLGRTATQAVLGIEEPMGRLRGTWQRLGEDIRVMPTWHPAYLLREPAGKREAWADLQQVMAFLGLPRSAGE